MQNTILSPLLSDNTESGSPTRVGRNYIDELLIFQVEKHLFRIPLNVLRASAHFCDMLDSDHVGDRSEGQTDDKPIVLTGIKSKEMDHFLDVLFPRRLEDPLEYSEEQLMDALHLSTMWGFQSVRDYTIKQISDRFSDPVTLDPFDRLELADKCDVPQWRLSEYIKICKRPRPISAEEGMRLGWRRFSALSSVREKAVSGNSLGGLSFPAWVLSVSPNLQVYCDLCGAWCNSSSSCSHSAAPACFISLDFGTELAALADQLDI